MIMPFGTYMTPKRLTGDSGDAARAVNAGTMLSSSGNASAAPAPRNIARREMAFLKTIMLGLFTSLSNLHLIIGAGRAHAERRAPDDPENNGGPAVILRRRIACNLADRRQIGVFDAAAERVRHQFLRERADEIFLVAG